MSAALRPLKLNKAGNIATLVVIGVAFIVTYATYLAELRSGQPPSIPLISLVIATLLGVVYLYLMLAGHHFMNPSVDKRTKTIYFVVAIALMLTIEYLLPGANGIWLISMPLIGTATTNLPLGPRWAVYVVAILGVIVPSYLRYDDWQVTFYIFLSFITAFVFVIAFVKINQSSEIAQHKAEQLATQLADANRRLGDYAIQAEELATMQERNRVAREIHDNLGHYLTVVNVQIKAAQALLEKDPARANQALEKAAQLTNEGLAAVRQSVSSLRESPLGRRTLAEAIAALAAETRTAGIIAEFAVNGSAFPLDPRAELTLYRAAQEGLTNVRKHARASRVDLVLDYNRPAVSLAIRDNGVGMREQDSQPGFGLLGLRERTRQLGGRLEIESPPGEGYRLILQLPDAAAEPAGGEERA